MSWEDIIKTRRHKSLTQEIDSDFTALSAWASFFWDMGAIDNSDMSQLWRFLEKPYNWQPEYELAIELMEALDEEDMGGLEEYMHKHQLFLFDKEKMKKHIQQLKGEKQ